MAKKYFTFSKAQELLPIIQVELHHLQRLQNEFQDKYVELCTLNDGEGTFELECQLEFLQVEANMYINNIHNQRVQLKDIDHGVIDFPAWIDGKEVLQCLETRRGLG